MISKQQLGLEPTAYTRNIAYLKNLELACSLEPARMEQAIEQSFSKMNFIQFLQQIPVPDHASTEWFVVNLNMLSCYEVLNNDAKMAVYAMEVEKTLVFR